MTDETPQPKPPHRPTIYTRELRDEICRRLASGMTLRAVCSMEGMPARVTIYDWCNQNKGCVKDEMGNVVEEGFSYHYTRARELGQDEINDEIIEIADDGKNDFIEIEGKDGKMKVIYDREAVARSKLRVETRQKYLENMAPRKYGKNAVVQVQALDKDGEPTDAFNAATETLTVLAAFLAKDKDDTQ